MKQKNLLMIGAGGQGKIAADIAELSGIYSRIVFLTDDLSVKQVRQYPVEGTLEQMERYLKAYDFFVAIGAADVREQIQHKIRDLGGNIITLIHPNAVVAKDAQIGPGSILMAGSIVSAGSRLGQGVIVNTASSVDHDDQIGDYVHIAVGAHLAGAVRVGEKTWVGAGATVSDHIEICSGCMIGAGAVVVRDVTEKGTYAGVPARRIK